VILRASRVGRLSALFDWLITGQIVPMNPAAAMCGLKHVVKTGKTSVLEHCRRYAMDLVTIRCATLIEFYST